MSVDNSEFCKSLEKATKQILQDIASRMELACLVVERDAKINCPVAIEKGGQLRGSITHNIEVTPRTITGSVFSPVDYAPYVEKGTGIYAKDGNGRKTPWVYVKGEHSKSSSDSEPTKTYTWDKALQIMAILQSKGIDARATKGQKPHPFLEPARDKNKGVIPRILAGKVQGE